MRQQRRQHSRTLAGVLATFFGVLGCADQPVNGAAPSATAIFPLRVEAGKRYLIDAQGRPFLIHGDAPWSLLVQPTRAEVDQYLEDRRVRGFNAVLVNIIEHQFSDNAPNNIFGRGPFLTPGLFSTPNEAYFAHVDYVIRKAAEKGILVILTPAYMGSGGGSEGWYQEMTSVLNGPVVLRSYGQYLARRLRAHDNILWVHGGDFNPPEKTLLQAIASGITDIETKWLHTFHGSRGTSALDFLGTSEPWLTVNATYVHIDDVVAEAFTEYSRSTMPFFQIEATYENESGAGGHEVRQQAYQAVLSGATGQVIGNFPLWRFASGWPAALNSAGSRSLIHLRALFEARAWHLLVPDQTGAVLTAGVSAGVDRAATARASDGSFVLTYTPSVRTLTLDITQLAGPNVVARWYDPTNGVFTAIAGSPFTASGPRTFTAPSANAAGDGDWVLVLESTP